MQSTVDPADRDGGNDAGLTIGSVKAIPKPTTNELAQIDTQDFWTLSALDKSWVISQSSALSCSLLVSIASGCVYFITDAVNCDGRSPYSVALVSGFYALMINMYSWLGAYKFRNIAKKLNAPNSWSLRARESRRQRTPVFLAMMASWQGIAAVIFWLVNHRTSSAPLSGWGIVPVIATIGLVSCLHSISYNLYLAFSIRRSQWSDLRIDIHEKSGAQPSTETEEESTLLYDIDLTALPAFDKQWLAVHVLVLVAMLSTGITSSTLLWQVPCSDSSRKPLTDLSENSFNIWPQLLSMCQFALQLWLARVGCGDAKKGFRQPRFLILSAQFYFVTVAVALSFGVYFAPNGSYGLVVVKVQTAVAAVAFLLCSGYNYALMLKTNFNDAPADDEKFEETTKGQNEQK